MKHSAAELLLAIHIRDQAKENRKTSCVAALNAWDKENPQPKDPPLVGYTQEEIQQLGLHKKQVEDLANSRDAFKISWLHKNPVNNFYLPALRELEEVADAIKAG